MSNRQLLPFVPTQRTAPDKDQRWYNNPDRPCKDDDRYTELLGVPKAERAEMKMACTTCPVYYECLDDLLGHAQWTHYGIQAAQQGLT